VNVTYKGKDWFHPYDASGDKPEAGVVSRLEILVDADFWPQIVGRLTELRITASDVTTAYGLTRATLPEGLDQATVMAELAAVSPDHRLGRNRLVARNVMQFDNDDLEGTPKVLPSEEVSPELVTDGATLSTPAEPAFGEPALGNGVRVGVIDSAFTHHASMIGAVLYQPAELADLLYEGQAEDIVGHATFIASQIKHIAPGAIVEVDTVIGSDGLGDTALVHDAICRMTEAGAQVISMSFGCVTADNEAPFALKHAIDYALDWSAEHGRPAPVFVASAGNFGDKPGLADKKFWPAADPRVWAVAGADNVGGDWQLAKYSGRGDWVDVAAPANGLLGARPSITVGETDWDAYAYWSGTSFSTAVIAALVARRLSDPAQSGSFKVNDVAASLGSGMEIKAAGQVIPMYGSQDVTLGP
jgi:Subtilase family